MTTTTRAQAREVLRRWVAGLGTTDETVTSPRLWVASLAAEGLWLGVYRDGPLDDELGAEEWARVVEGVARYAGDDVHRRPTRTIAFEDALLDEAPFRDERPLVDAVLQACVHEGVEKLTLALVAARSGRSESALRSSFGSVDALVDDVVAEVVASGFDDLSPLSLDPSPAGVAANLDAFADSRKAAALLRLYLFAGIDRTPPPEEERAVLAAALTGGRASDATPGTQPDGTTSGTQPDGTAGCDDLLVAALAFCAHRAGLREPALQYPVDLPRAVVDELARAVR